MHGVLSVMSRILQMTKHLRVLMRSILPDLTPRGRQTRCGYWRFGTYSEILPLFPGSEQITWLTLVHHTRRLSFQPFANHHRHVYQGSTVEQMDNAGINTIFYEDEIFHMALVQMKSRTDHVDQAFEFIVNRKGGTMSFIMIILEH